MLKRNGNDVPFGSQLNYMTAETDGLLEGNLLWNHYMWGKVTLPGLMAYKAKGSHTHLSLVPAWAWSSLPYKATSGSSSRELHP